MLGLAVWAVLSNCGNTLAMFLNGAGIIKLQVIISCILGIGCLLLKIFFTRTLWHRRCSLGHGDHVQLAGRSAVCVLPPWDTATDGRKGNRGGRLKLAMSLPVSTRGFMATVFVLRKLGILRHAKARVDNQVRRILVSYPYGNLGDQVLTLPMLEALHSQWPEAAIDLVVNAKTADLLSAIPFVDHVYRFSIRNSAIRESHRLFAIIRCRGALPK